MSTIGPYATWERERKTVKTEGKTHKCRLAMAGLCAGRPRPTILSTYSQKSFSASCGFICAQWPMWSIRPQAIGYRARSSFAENSALAQSQFCANGQVPKRTGWCIFKVVSCAQCCQAIHALFSPQECVLKFYMFLIQDPNNGIENGPDSGIRMFFCRGTPWNAWILESPIVKVKCLFCLWCQALYHEAEITKTPPADPSCINCVHRSGRLGLVGVTATLDNLKKSNHETRGNGWDGVEMTWKHMEPRWKISENCSICSATPATPATSSGNPNPWPPCCGRSCRKAARRSPPPSRRRTRSMARGRCRQGWLCKFRVFTATLEFGILGHQRHQIGTMNPMNCFKRRLFNLLHYA